MIPVIRTIQSKNPTIMTSEAGVDPKATGIEENRRVKRITEPPKKKAYPKVTSHPWSVIGTQPRPYFLGRNQCIFELFSILATLHLLRI
jgi:hypothetical protein